MGTPRAVVEYLRAHFLGKEHEAFVCLFMDTRHRLIQAEEVFRGSIDGAEVHPREIVKRSLALNAAAVILAHNHPSGVTEPSAADRAVTMRLKQALALVDVRVLDHFIVGGVSTMSFAARGML